MKQRIGGVLVLVLGAVLLTTGLHGVSPWAATRPAARRTPAGSCPLPGRRDQVRRDRRRAPGAERQHVTGVAPLNWIVTISSVNCTLPPGSSATVTVPDGGRGRQRLRLPVHELGQDHVLPLRLRRDTGHRLRPDVRSHRPGHVRRRHVGRADGVARERHLSSQRRPRTPTVAPTTTTLSASVLPTSATTPATTARPGRPGPRAARRSRSCRRSRAPRRRCPSPARTRGCTLRCRGSAAGARPGHDRRIGSPAAAPAGPPPLTGAVGPAPYPRRHGRHRAVPPRAGADAASARSPRRSPTPAMP